MRKRLAALVLVPMLLGACGSDLLAPAAAVVNGDKITVDEIDEALEQYERSEVFQQFAEQGNAAEFKRAFQQSELTWRILIAVLSEEAEARDLTVTNADIDAAIQREIRETYDGNRSKFEEDLREHGIAPTDLPDMYRVILLEQRLKDDVTADLTPADAELRAFYNDNRQRYIATDVSHIVLETRSEAARIAKSLSRVAPDDVESRFAALAREESIDTASAAAGGQLPTLIPGEGDPAFEQAATQLAPGDVSQPVHTDLGWELILVRDRRPIPFADVRSEIIETLAGEQRDRRWNEWLTETFTNADIEVNPRYGEFDPETRQVVDPSTSDLPGTEDVAPTPAPATPFTPAG